MITWMKECLCAKRRNLPWCFNEIMKKSGWFLKKFHNGFYGVSWFCNAHNQSEGKEEITCLYSPIIGLGLRSNWTTLAVQLQTTLIERTHVTARWQLWSLSCEQVIIMAKDRGIYDTVYKVTCEKFALARKHKLWGQMLCHKIHGS